MNYKLCNKCKRWIWFTEESTVVRCPYCYSDLTVDKQPKEGNEDA